MLRLLRRRTLVRAHEFRPGQLKFLGTGEAFDQDLPNTSILCCLGPYFLVDCGHTIPPLLWRALPDPDKLDAVYLTHLHGDHVFGLPSVLYRFWEDGRRRPLTIIGSRGVDTFAAKILKLAYRIGWTDLPFKVRFLIATPGNVVQYKGVRLSFAKSRHPVTNLAVRFDWEGKPFAISGDGSPTEATTRLFRGCDLVIHEAFQDEVFQPVHASLPNVIEMAHSGGAKRLALIHLSRRFRSQAGSKAETYAKSGMRIFIPRPGQTVTV
jgi:ribonuclease BN (tRNA processing enzyme)